MYLWVLLEIGEKDEMYIDLMFVNRDFEKIMMVIVMGMLLLNKKF